MITISSEVLGISSPEKIIRDFSVLSGRVGLFGGSFDPIHSVHLEIAAELLAGGHLDRVIFIPAAQNPLKTVRPVSDLDRLAMILWAIADRPGLYVSPLELDRGDLSYTVDTLSEIARKVPAGVELSWIIGSDCVGQLSQWHRISEIFSLARVLVVQRDQVMTPAQWRAFVGSLNLDEKVRLQLIQNFIARAPNPVSSTAIRNRLLRGGAVSAVPDQVAAYIRSKNLYR